MNLYETYSDYITQTGDIDTVKWTEVDVHILE